MTLLALRPSSRESTAPDKKRSRKRGVPPLRGILPLVILLGAWELFRRGEETVYSPPPSEWFSEVYGLWSDGDLGPALAASFRTFIVALVVATLLGTMLGALVGRVRAADRLLGPLLEFCRVMPAAAVVPLAVLFAGYTQSMKVAVVVFTAIWPILLQVRAAARSLDPLLFDVGKSMHLSRWGTLRKIVIPSLVPAVMLGIRVAAPTVLIIVLLVEIVTGIVGIGALIEKAQQDYIAAQVYGLVTLTGVVALIVNSVVAGVESYVLRYRQE